jgi:hypothetical protein
LDGGGAVAFCPKTGKPIGAKNTVIISNDAIKIFCLLMPAKILKDLEYLCIDKRKFDF